MRELGLSSSIVSKVRLKMWLTRMMAKKFAEILKGEIEVAFAVRRPPDRAIDIDANLGPNNKVKSDSYL